MFKVTFQTVFVKYFNLLFSGKIELVLIWVVVREVLTYYK